MVLVVKSVRVNHVWMWTILLVTNGLAQETHSTYSSAISIPFSSLFKTQCVFINIWKRHLTYLDDNA